MTARTKRPSHPEMVGPFCLAGYACTLALAALVDPLHHPHHPRQLAVSQARSRGQTEPIHEEGLGNGAANGFREPLGRGKDGLQMHGLPDGASFDIFGFEGQT